MILVETRRKLAVAFVSLIALAFIVWNNFVQRIDSLNSIGELTWRRARQFDQATIQNEQQLTNESSILAELAFNDTNGASEWSAPSLNKSTPYAGNLSSSDSVLNSTASSAKQSEEASRGYVAEYTKFIPKRERERPILTPKSLTEEDSDPIRPSCNITNDVLATKWNVCDPVRCNVSSPRLMTQYTRLTKWGQNTGEFVNQVLKTAWGPDPPVVDLFVRSWCPGFAELSLMLESIEVFWPRFLGHVLIVLDYGNEEVAEKLLPIHLRSHSYRVIYEHGYCMSGRVYSQFSYLNSYRHSNADYIVTFDSDCAFFHPVTPDLLFSKIGRKVIMPMSQSLVNLGPAINSVFDDQQFFFTKIHDGNYGTAMVTQPITAKASTLPRFLRWIQEKREKCHEFLSAEFDAMAEDVDYRRICWMCQLGVYIATTGDQDYDVHYLNTRHDPFLRFATHYQYEKYQAQMSQEALVGIAIQQGLCRAFGASVFGACRNMVTDYVGRLTTHYAFDALNRKSTHHELQEAQTTMLQRLKKATWLSMPL